MNAILLGANSDIGKELGIRLMADGWNVHGVGRNPTLLPEVHWDLMIVAIGQLWPIGNFFDIHQGDWFDNFDSNLFEPLRLLRRFWPTHNPGASVCFFSGAGTSNSAKTYSAYSSSKIALFKMAELLDDECSDAKFFIIGPGMVRTKIQQQTLDAGKSAANYERVKQFMETGDSFHGTGTSHDRIYKCLRWAMELPKEVVGGRNLYAPEPFGEELARRMRDNPRLMKLRRYEDAVY